MTFEPIIVQGRQGWGNRKVGTEAYGPGGRWSDNGLGTKDGDLLGDALEREGSHEGAELLVIAVQRFGRYQENFERIAEFARSLTWDDIRERS